MLSPSEQHKTLTQLIHLACDNFIWPDFEINLSKISVTTQFGGKQNLACGAHSIEKLVFNEDHFYSP